MMDGDFEESVSVGACLGCRYSLVGLTVDRCPECGRAFDRHDPRTMFTKRVPDEVAFWLLQPLGWKMTAAIVLISIGTFWAATIPGDSLSLVLLLLLGWLGLAAYGALRLLLRVALGFSYSVRLRGKRELVGWVVPPLLALLMFFVIRHNVPFRVAFASSRPSLDHFAKQLIAHPPSHPSSNQRTKVGWYHVENPVVMAEGARFDICGAGFMGVYGFAYLPFGVPKSPSDGALYQHIVDDWYQFTISW